MHFTSTPALTSEPPLVEPYALKAAQRVNSSDCRGNIEKNFFLRRACKLPIISVHRNGTALRKHIRGKKSWHSQRLETRSLALVWSRSSLPAVPFPPQRLRKITLRTEWRKFAQQ